MKPILFIMLMGFFTHSCSQTKSTGEQKIITLKSDELPIDVVNKLQSISTPEKLSDFKYHKVFTAIHPMNSSITVEKIVDLKFDDGKIAGTLRIKFIENGSSEDMGYKDIELCYLFCCVLKTTETEKCSEDYKEFKKWETNPGCKSTKITACY